MVSLFRTLGTGISSDIESTIVPQLLAEIDGVESLKNVIVIGASNREDLIDPAILRPGRLDVKIKIERPDEESARQIFTRYLRPTLPIAEEEITEHGDLPNTTNPDDWAKISGKKGERIVYVRTLLTQGDEATGGRQIERVTTGQYL